VIILYTLLHSIKATFQTYLQKLNSLAEWNWKLVSSVNAPKYQKSKIILGIHLIGKWALLVLQRFSSQKGKIPYCSRKHWRWWNWRNLSDIKFTSTRLSSLLASSERIKLLWESLEVYFDAIKEAKTPLLNPSLENRLHFDVLHALKKIKTHFARKRYKSQERTQAILKLFRKKPF